MRRVGSVFCRYGNATVHQLMAAGSILSPHWCKWTRLLDASQQWRGFACLYDMVFLRTGQENGLLMLYMNSGRMLDVAST